MKFLIALLFALAISGSAEAHDSHVDRCDYRLLDGKWDVFYPGGDPGLGDTARLEITGYSDRTFKIVLRGDDNWTANVTVSEEDCLDAIGPIVGFDITEKTSDAEEPASKKICVHRIGDLLGLMRSDRGGLVNLRQIGIYSATSGVCVTRDKDGNPIEKLTPGHAHADD